VRGDSNRLLRAATPEITALAMLSAWSFWSRRIGDARSARNMFHGCARLPTLQRNTVPKPGDSFFRSCGDFRVATPGIYRSVTQPLMFNWAGACWWPA